MSEEDKVVELLEILEHLKNPIFFREYDEEHQIEIIKNLKELGLVEKLIELVKDEDDNLSRAAIFALGQIGDKRAIKPLINELGKETDSLTIRGIVETLGEFGDIKALKPLKEKLEVAWDSEMKEIILEDIRKIES